MVRLRPHLADCRLAQHTADYHATRRTITTPLSAARPHTCINSQHSTSALLWALPQDLPSSRLMKSILGMDIARSHVTTQPSTAEGHASWIRRLLIV